MFYEEEDYCYAVADSYDGDFCIVDGEEYAIDYDYLGFAFIMKGRQSYILTGSVLNY